MPLLALVSGNPPERERNPFRFTGPSITFAPFSPLPVSVDLLGIGYVGGLPADKKQNPQPSTVVFNVFTEEARRYPNPPLEAIGLAWADDHAREGVPVELGRLPVQVGGGFVRSGPWMAQVVEHRAATTNPWSRAPSKRFGWATLALEIMWQIKQEQTPGYADQLHGLARPAVRLTHDTFWHVYSRQRVSAVELERSLAHLPDLPSRLQAAKRLQAAARMPKVTSQRAYEHWKHTTRALGLERPDVYDAQYNPQTGWFAFDALAAFDAAWAELGTPHPLDMLVGMAYAPIAPTVAKREQELLASAMRRPGLTRQQREGLEAATQQARSFQGGRYPRRLQAPELTQARRLAVEPVLAERRAVVAMTRPWHEPEPAETRGGVGGETEGERWRRERAEWQAAREQAIRTGAPIPAPPRLPGAFVPTRPARIGRVGEEEETVTPSRLPFAKRVGEELAGYLPPAEPVAPPRVTQAIRELAELYKGAFGSYGAQARLAKDLVTPQVNVFNWLRGHEPAPGMHRKILDLYSRRVRPLKLVTERDWAAAMRELVVKVGTGRRAAQVLGVHPSYVTQIGKGQRPANEDLKNKIAAALAQRYERVLPYEPFRHPEVAPWKPALQELLTRWAPTALAWKLSEVTNLRVDPGNMRRWLKHEGTRASRPKVEVQHAIVELARQTREGEVAPQVRGVKKPSWVKDPGPSRFTGTMAAELIRLRDQVLGDVTDEALERKLGAGRGWFARARSGSQLRGRAYLTWRRLRALIEERGGGQVVTSSVPAFNPRRRNRDSKWKAPLKVEELPVGEFSDDPNLESRQSAYKRFHGKLAEKVKLFHVPDGKRETTVAPLMVGLHETLEVPYQVPWESTKRGDNPREPITWSHEFPMGSRPLKVLDPRTGITFDVGGSYLIDDYWYS